MNNRVIVVIGAGPGIGRSVALRFGREGYDVALIARSAEQLETLGQELQAEGVTAGWAAVDITDEQALRDALQRFGGHAGHLDVLHFNPSAFRAKNPLDLTPDELLDDVRLGVASLLTAVQAARPFLPAESRIVVTGSSAADQPWHEAASLGVQKAAVRNLVASVDATLRGDGCRAMTLSVNGTLAPGTAFSPDRVADVLYRATLVPDADWRTEVAYDG